MLYFSSYIPREYTGAAVVIRTLYAALDRCGESYMLFNGAADMWARDYMPVKTRSGRYVSFRYDPVYLKDKAYAPLRTVYKRDLAPAIGLPVTYSCLVLDGGNVVFSPSRRRAVVSERAFAENPGLSQAALTARLERLLEARVIWIESLPSDMTGHADGMVRFVDEHTVLSNRTDFQNGLEQRNRRRLEQAGLRVIDFPYEQSRGISAEGCYLNYLQTQRHLFLPVFGLPQDAEAESTARALFRQQVVPVPAAGLARHGGVFHCVSWADEAHL